MHFVTQEICTNLHGVSQELHILCLIYKVAEPNQNVMSKGNRK